MNPSAPHPAPPVSLEPEYTDTQAMDDIQALITSRGRPKGDDAIEEVTEIIERTGRAIVTPRIFQVAQAPKEDGLPSVSITAEGTYILVEQNPDTDSIDVRIHTISGHDERHLLVKLNGRQLTPAVPRP